MASFSANPGGPLLVSHRELQSRGLALHRRLAAASAAPAAEGTLSGTAIVWSSHARGLRHRCHYRGPGKGPRVIISRVIPGNDLSHSQLRIATGLSRGRMVAVRAQGADGGENQKDEGKDSGAGSEAESGSGAQDSPASPGGGEGQDGADADSAAAAIEALQRLLPLPRSVVETLRDQVFGFDTFFVTGQEPYEGGVLFQGNLRGEPAKVYAKINERLKARFGDEFLLYLLRSPEDDRPVAVVIPADSVVVPGPGLPDSLGAGAFGLVTALTTLLSNSPSPDFGFLPSTEYLLGPLLQGAPAAGIFILGMLVHEAGHVYVGRRLGLDLALPYFIPSWQLGSFGAITRIKSVVPNRAQLVEVAAAGPLAGALASLALLVLTLLTLHPDPALGDLAITVDASAFQDSFLVGGLAKLVLGDSLTAGTEVALSPLTLAAWSALLANAINAIPAGELDGGRIAHGLFGRKGATRLTFVSLVLLGITGIFNDVALYWVVLISFLQRGPIPPQTDEITPPTTQAKALGTVTLVLGLLVYFPLPFSL